MTAMQALPALQETSLVVTDEQVVNARGNKAIGFLPLHPIELLRLTMMNQGHMEEILAPLADLKGAKKSLSFYNRLAEAGEILVPPFLMVAQADGRVVGHEGRHRAGALFRADPHAFMWVAITLKDEHGYGMYKEELKWPEYRYLGREDMPRAFIGQFRLTRVEIDPAQLVEIWPR